MGRQKMSVEAKIKKEYPQFVEEIASLSVDQLNSRLAELAKQTDEVEQAKDDDEELDSAKDKVSEFSAPYRDAKKMLKLKSRYVIGLIREKGSS